MPRLIRILTLSILVLLGACQTTLPDNALALPAKSLELRQLQTRRFEGIAEPDLLGACASVLQDLGFNLDESETELGLIVASKKRPAHTPSQATAAILLKLFVGVEIAIDKEQRIRASLVTQPATDTPQSFLVRVTFQRIVWNDENEISRGEPLNELELYQRFFDRLSESVFLEANSI